MTFPELEIRTWLLIKFRDSLDRQKEKFLVAYFRQFLSFKMVQKILNLGQDFGKCLTFRCDNPPDQPFLIISYLFFGWASSNKKNWGKETKEQKTETSSKFWVIFNLKILEKKQILKIFRPFGRKLQPALVDFFCSPRIKTDLKPEISSKKNSDFEEILWF